MQQPLLIEIGVEELPAEPLLRIVGQIEHSWETILSSYRLSTPFEFFYTPRRLTLWHPKFPARQPDRQEALYGPPVAIAFKEGKPTRAAESFAKKCDVSIEALGRSKKGNKEVLYFERTVEGAPVEALLETMLKEWLSLMRFGKSMRWGERSETFIRPVRWIVAMHGKQRVPLELFGVVSSSTTRLHRQVSTIPVDFKDSKAYFATLQAGGVILSPAQRYERIIKQCDAIEKEASVQIERDEALMQEIVAITEYPTALLGTFDVQFLRLPPEVIMTSMKEHQRYFPVFKDGVLHHAFVVVSNAKTDDFSQIIAGNERVLRPRLSDAAFFYDNDCKRGLDPEGLKGVIFMDGLGSMYDKSVRESNIATTLYDLYAQQLQKSCGLELDEGRALIERAAMLSKADLLSEMVYEFTELQGIMGYYYAKEQGEAPLVCEAIRDQYLPDKEDGPLPAHLFSALLALSYKLDNLLSLFSIGKIPTGSRDPFGLRRAASGIIRIVSHFGLPFEITAVIERFKAQYAPFETQTLEHFFLERFYKQLSVNPSIIKAVLEGGERDIVEIIKKSRALDQIAQSDAFAKIFSTFKRVANICKTIDLSTVGDVDPSLFQKEQERILWEAFLDVNRQKYDDYKEALEALFSLKPQLDCFFDHVMVNDPDAQLRANRSALIAHIYLAFRRIADIKEISI